MELYLVTGFLGAGKTTFLKHFTRLFAGKQIALVINEFGKEGVDGKLVSELGVLVNEISNGSIFCSCRLDKFEEVLEQLQNQCPDIIIVEASGLSDPTNIRKILEQNGRFSDIEYKGSICLVDGVNFEKVYQMARVCKKQVAVSDMAIINKTDLASEEQLAYAENTLLTQKPDLVIYRTQFGEIQPEWVHSMVKLTDLPQNGEIHSYDITLKKFLITIKDGFTPQTLMKFVEMFSLDCYRVKGFVRMEGGCYLVDCVQNIVKITPYDGQIAEEQLQKIVALSGNGLPAKKGIQEAVKWYQDFIESVE